jgi:hypothetical protein
MSPLREVAQERGDLRFAHVARVFVAVEAHKAPDPPQIHLFRAPAVVSDAHLPPDCWQKAVIAACLSVHRAA